MKASFPAIALLLLHTICSAQNPQQPTSQQQTGKRSGGGGAGIGIKGGINFPNVNSTSALSTSNASGFTVGAFLGSSYSGQVLGYRGEFIYSRQGYDYETNTNTGNVSLSYLLMPQLMTISITKFVQLQAGPQMAILLNAKADSTKGGSGSEQFNQMEYLKRVQFGFAGGIEIHPFKGILVGARYNLSWGNMYSSSTTPGPGSSMLGVLSANPKNNVLQVFAGYQF